MFTGRVPFDDSDGANPYPAVALAPSGLDHSTPDDARLVQNVNERVEQCVVEVGRARVAQEEVGHLPKLVHETREAVLDDRDALQDVLLHPARHAPALEARCRRLDDEHQACAATRAKLLADLVAGHAALAEDF